MLLPRNTTHYKSLSMTKAGSKPSSLTLGFSLFSEQGQWDVDLSQLTKANRNTLFYGLNVSVTQSNEHPHRKLQESSTVGSNSLYPVRDTQLSLNVLVPNKLKLDTAFMQSCVLQLKHTVITDLVLIFVPSVFARFITFAICCHLRA